MALFFDHGWFDTKLKDRGATREDIARLLNISASQLSEMWKDQRELRAAEVLALAEYLNVSAAEIANRAGVSTPVPRDAGEVHERLNEMSERLARIERMIVELKTLVLAKNLSGD